MDIQPKKTNIPVNSDGKGDNIFKTPEQIASTEHPEPDIILDDVDTAENPTIDNNQASPKGLTTKKIHRRLWDKFQSLSKRRKVIVLIVTVVVLIGIVTGLVLALSSKTTPKTVAPPKQATIKTAPKPTTVASNLTGLQVDPSVNQRPVTGIMIENSDAARPQSGIIDAGVVFEAVTEGGITRFLTLFQDNQPASVGPIRSVRPYFLSWDLGFDAPIAHVGGSPEALNDVKSWGDKDLDEFYNGASYTRISSREAPHNVYTSLAKLQSLEAGKGWTSSAYTSFPRKPDAPAKTPATTTINLSPSSFDFSITYNYDATTNSYNRMEAGTPMTDAVSGAQLSPKVVITMVVPLAQGALDASGAYYSDFSVLGSGQADVFQDGIEVTGTWSKPTNSSQITFTTASGAPLKLNAGQIWITALGSASEISFK